MTRAANDDGRGPRIRDALRLASALARPEKAREMDGCGAVCQRKKLCTLLSALAQASHPTHSTTPPQKLAVDTGNWPLHAQTA